MDNMKSKFTVQTEDREVRSSGKGGINFADFMDQMNTDDQDGGAAGQIEITDLENANRITGQGETISNVILEKKMGGSQAGKPNFGAFMDNMDSEEAPGIIFSREEGGNAKFSGKVSVADNRSSFHAETGQRVGNFFGAGKGEVGNLLSSFTAKKNQLQELIKSKDGKNSRGGSSYIQKRVTPGPEPSAESKPKLAYDFADFMDHLDSGEDKDSEKAEKVETPPESPQFYQGQRAASEKSDQEK